LFHQVLPDSTLHSIYDAHRGACYERAFSFANLVHLVNDSLCQHGGRAKQTLDRHARSGERPASEQAFYGKLRRMPIGLSEAFLAEATERRLVSLGSLSTDRLLKGRGRLVRLLRIERRRFGPPLPPPNLIPHAIQHRLPKVRLQGAFTLRLKAFDSLKRLKEDILDKILRIRHVARPSRQPPARPSAQRSVVAGEQAVQRFRVPFACARQELEGRFRFGHGVA